MILSNTCAHATPPEASPTTLPLPDPPSGRALPPPRPAEGAGPSAKKRKGVCVLRSAQSELRHLCWATREVRATRGCCFKVHGEPARRAVVVARLSAGEDRYR